MPTLFHHDLVVAVLGSGSTGNATYIGDGRHGLLVDCGLSTRQLRARMAEVGLEGAPIDAVLLTHEHSDHVGAAAVLDRALHRETGRRVPFHLTAGTRRGLHERCVPTDLREVSAGRAFPVGPWTVEPVAIPHDTAEPVAYTVQIGALRVGVITDLGSTTPRVERQLASLDVAVLEFNHDEAMLRDGPYPWALKQRVGGRWGHLSNEQAGAMLAGAAAAGRLRHVVLAHLSEENNTEHLAREVAERALHRAGRRDLTLAVGRPREPIAPYQVAVASPAPAPATRAAAVEAQQRLFG